MNNWCVQHITTRSPRGAKKCERVCARVFVSLTSVCDSALSVYYDRDWLCCDNSAFFQFYKRAFPATSYLISEHNRNNCDAAGQKRQMNPSVSFINGPSARCTRGVPPHVIHFLVYLFIYVIIFCCRNCSTGLTLLSEYAQSDNLCFICFFHLNSSNLDADQVSDQHVWLNVSPPRGFSASWVLSCRVYSTCH